MLFQLNALFYLLLVASIGLGIAYFALPKERKHIQLLFLIFTGLTCFLFLNNIFVVSCILIIIVVAALGRNPMLPGIYIFLLFTTPFISKPVQAGGVYLMDFNFAHCLSFGMLLAMIVGRGSAKRAAGLVDLCAFLLILLFFLANIRGGSATNAIRELMNSLLSYGLPYYVLSRSVRSQDDLRPIFLGTACAMAVLSAIAIFEVWRSWPIYRGIWGHYGLELTSGASVKLRGGMMRAAGPYPEPLSFSFVMTMALIGLIVMYRNFATNSYYALLILFCFAGIMMPQGRTAWLGLVVALLVLDLFRRNYQALSIKAGLLAISGLVLLLAASFSHRLATLLGLTAEGQGTVDYRERLLARGIEEFWKNPVFGDAIGNVLGRMEDLIQGEGIVDLVNGYLHVALISGGVGLAIFMLTLFGFAGLLVQSQRKARHEGIVLSDNALAWAMASLFAIMVMLTTMSIVGRPFLMLIVVFAIGASAMRLTRYQHRLTATNDAAVVPALQS
jgi:O-Antigen ligase